VTFLDSSDSLLNTANLCPAISVLDVIMLLTYCVLCVVYLDEVKDVYDIREMSVTFDHMYN